MMSCKKCAEGVCGCSTMNADESRTVLVKNPMLKKPMIGFPQVMDEQSANRISVSIFHHFMQKENPNVGVAVQSANANVRKVVSVDVATTKQIP